MISEPELPIHQIHWNNMSVCTHTNRKYRGEGKKKSTNLRNFPRTEDMNFQIKGTWPTEHIAQWIQISPHQVTSS